MNPINDEGTIKFIHVFLNTTFNHGNYSKPSLHCGHEFILAFKSTFAETNSTDLKQELLRLKQKCDILEKENKETSDLFEEKRSKFKEVYHAKESKI